MHTKQAKSILSARNSMNIYRGCTHGCIYCDSRSRCYQMDHEFEDIEVKINAPELLEEALKRKRKKCMIGTGAMTDPYIHLEDRLGHMRRCIEIIKKYGFGLAIQTKSARIMRDIDLLQKINEKSKCVVQMTLTTYDEKLCKILEPNVSTTAERVDVLKNMRNAGIPTVVWLDPILPFINDTEENLRGIMRYCVEAGVYGIICFGMGLTLREGNREYFYRRLDRHFPGMKEKYHKKFGYAYECMSEKNAELMGIFHGECRKHGIVSDVRELFRYMSTYEEKSGMEQLSLI